MSHRAAEVSDRRLRGLREASEESEDNCPTSFREAHEKRMAEPAGDIGQAFEAHLASL